MTRTQEEWVAFLVEQFDETEYEQPTASYYGWCAAGVDPDNALDDVAAAWIEQQDGQGRKDAESKLAQIRTAIMGDAQSIAADLEGIQASERDAAQRKPARGE